MKSAQNGVYSSPYFPAFALNTDQEIFRILTIFTNIQGIVIRISSNINDIYNKKQIYQKTLNNSVPSIKPCGTPNIISNQVL